MDNYIEPPLNFTGSKYKLLPQILPKFDYSKSTFIDLFCGGGSVYSNVLDKYERIFASDIIGDLIGIHQELLVCTEPFVQRVKMNCVEKDDKEGFLVLRESYNEVPSPARLYALMLCSTNNFMRFNRKFKFNNTFGKRTFNSNTQKKIDAFVKHCKPYLHKIALKQSSFKDIPVDKDAFYYIDPPFTGTEAGYNAYWNKNDDVELFTYVNRLFKAGATFAVSGLERDGKTNPFMELLGTMDGYGLNKYYLDGDYGKVARKKGRLDRDLLFINYELG